MPDPFTGDHFEIREQVLAFPHRKFRVYDEQGTLLLFCKMRGFRLKEDIRLYADEAQTRELISIQARSIIDFSAAYDVLDMTTGQKLGVMRRKGFSSMIRDSWEILDADDRPRGNVIEDSMLKALVRRFVDFATWFMPQKFHVDLAGQRAATFKQNYNPFHKKLKVDFESTGPLTLDRKLGLAAGILMVAIEGKQT